jgi:mannitol/fructose-specific phosphotransferase system IIA component (Ntr-type)
MSDLNPRERLTRVLEAGTIRVDFAAPDLSHAVRDLLVPALAAHHIAAARIDAMVDAVLKREESGSTSSGAVALPHARVSDLPAIITGFGINASGIYGGGDVQFLMTFVSPQESPSEHLRFLSEAAKVFRSDALLDRLREAKSAEDVLQILRA